MFLRVVRVKYGSGYWGGVRKMTVLAKGNVEKTRRSISTSHVFICATRFKEISTEVSYLPEIK